VAFDYKQHSILGVPQGLEGLRSYFATFAAAFPDMRLNVEEMIAEGDKVVVKGTTTGTQTGEFMGHPPSGKKISVPEIDIFRVSDEMIVEHWDVVDRYAMFDQLGWLSLK